jgi:tetratricopeptide (TPR) repeat protein
MNQKFELFLSGTDFPHRYKVSTSGQNGEGVIEDYFELRSDSVELTMTLSALVRAASSGEQLERELHVEFGQRIYKLLFGGALGKYWKERRNSAGRNPLALALRIDAKSARFLQRIPWEYMHDGKDFLATNWRTPVYRLPANIEPIDFEPLKEPLRMLVVIPVPLGLNENEVLHFSKEEDLILAATAQARKTGRLRLEFTPNGAMETLEQYLREYSPHLLHFVGHGVFVDSADSGLLLMETQDGHRREVWNKDFTEVLVKNGRELRGMFLSACQSAVAPRAEGFGDLAPHLLEEGIPAVIAMQHSVLNISAMAFGSTFYKGIAEGKLIEDAFTDARQALNTSSPNNFDFATPVLFLSDPDCLRVDVSSGQVADTPLDLSGLTKAQNFVGRAGEIRELQTRLDPQNGTWRAAVIHAIGGMGKTVLAARLAERMASRLDGVISLRMAPSTTTQQVLGQIADFLIAHNGQFNLSEIHEFQQSRTHALELSVRIGMLAQILRRLRLLVILDNCEDILPFGREVSRAAGVEQPASLDPELLPLIASLVGSVDGPSRLIFTSRVDFSPVEENRLTDSIGHLSLKEMGFREAVYLMETLPPLDNLPVVILNPMNGTFSPQPVAMRDVYNRLGGHPYRLNLFARYARLSSVPQALDDLSDVHQELMEFTLLEKAVAQLSERAALLVHCGAVFEEPVPVEGLAFMLGDEQDAMPDVSTELEELRNWGLMAWKLGTDDYSFHSLVRDWARETWNDGERKDYLRRAARYWLGVGRDSDNLWVNLRARQYLYQAGDYEDAGNIVQTVSEALIRSGHIMLSLVLLRQSVESLQGKPQYYAIYGLATIYQRLGDYANAQKSYTQVLEVAMTLGDKHIIALTLHQIGMLNEQKGDYNHALEFYQQSRKIFDELGDRENLANSLHQMGNLHYYQGDNQLALDYYQQSLKIRVEMCDQAGVSTSLMQIGFLYAHEGDCKRALMFYRQSLTIEEEISDRSGMAFCLTGIASLYSLQGHYLQALEYYQRSLKIREEIGDRLGLALNLHDIGILFFQQGDYKQAKEYHYRSLKIAEEIGDRPGVANNLHGVGMIYQQQGEYQQALKYVQQSLDMYKEIGNRPGIARGLYQMGVLHFLEGDHKQALEVYQQSQTVFEAIGDRMNVASCQHQIGMLYQLQGDYSQAWEFYRHSLKTREATGDQAGVAKSLHQIGMLHQLQEEYPQALGYYQQSLKIKEEIGDRAGVAMSLGQLGLLYQQTDQLENAINVLIRAFILFAEMGMSQAAQAKHDLNMLRSKVGEDTFVTVVQATGLPAETQSSLLQAFGDRVAQSHSDKPDIRPVLIQDTIAVLIDVPDKKGEWWKELRKLEQQAKEQNEQDLAWYMHGLVRLVEGAEPASLTASIPDEFKPDWQAILDSVLQKE